jgi:hypothetical protein
MLTVSVGYEADGVTSSCEKDVYSTSCWDYVLYARTTCGSAAAPDEIGCSDNQVFDSETLTFPVTANTPYFVFVDGLDGNPYSTGPFGLVIDLQ